MPVYQYRGYRSDGGAAAGIVDAESVKVAQLKLRKDGVFPTDVVEQGQAQGRGGSRDRLLAPPPTGRSQVLSAADLAMLTRQFATLLVAGLPLVEALGILIDQAERKPVKALLADVREQGRGGKALSSALESYGHDFSQI